MLPVNLNRKRNVFIGVFVALFLVLLLGFFKLQINEAFVYSQRSRQNSIKMVTEILSTWFPMRRPTTPLK